MPDIKGSATERNLLTAFSGESQARNRYTYFASVAKKEGFQQISTIFAETADQEKEHAKRLFKFLEGGEVEVSASFPAGVIGSTLENLKESAAGEHHEHAEMYPGFAKIAREEGFKQIASVFDAIAVAEKQHEKRYKELAANIEAGRVFEREKKVAWRCRNCGYVHEGTRAPKVCPACETCPGAFRAAGGELVAAVRYGLVVLPPERTPRFRFLGCEASGKQIFRASSKVRAKRGVMPLRICGSRSS